MKPEPAPLPCGETAFALLERNIPSPVKLCDPWAIEGVNIIAGRPKLGKTTLERQKLAAAATGGPFLDSSFPKAVGCLFLSLEEGELLCREKFKMAAFSDEALGAITLHFQWPRGKEGVDLLDRYLKANAGLRLVCIDSLTKFRAVPDVRTPAFMADYDAMSSIHEMSKNHPGVCIDVIHHTRKAKSEDPIDDVSGTYGLTAATDSVSVMRHCADGATLTVESRLWSREDHTFTLKRGAQRWEMVGVDAGLSKGQEEAFDLVKASAAGIGGKDLGDKLGITTQSAWERLDSLIEKGVAIKRFGKVRAK